MMIDLLGQRHNGCKVSGGLFSGCFHGEVHHITSHAQNLCVHPREVADVPVET